MERMSLGAISMKYPKKWVIAVNVAWEENRLCGEVYKILEDSKEAIRIEKELDNKGEMGRVAAVEGYDDTPRIGGLFVV
ncbi:MAG: hypothetical protein FWH05_04540 [Oscillospiraceae bacterium]|nr:hypothetical protein [Oscillospiraceae bacterium]